MSNEAATYRGVGVPGDATFDPSANVRSDEYVPVEVISLNAKLDRATVAVWPFDMPIACAACWPRFHCTCCAAQSATWVAGFAAWLHWAIHPLHWVSHV